MNNNNFSSESDVVDAELIESSDDKLHSSKEASDSQANHSQCSNTAGVSNKKSANLTSNLLSTEHWLRFVFMALFVVVAFTASYIMFVLIVIQFVFTLVTGESNTRLQVFAQSLSQYIFQMLRFLTYNSEDKPFPFADWPQAESRAAENVPCDSATAQQV